MYKEKNLEIKYFLQKWDFLIVLYIVTCLVVVLAISITSEAQIKAGDIAPKTYEATRVVENEIATKRNSELAKAEVETIYIVDESKNQAIFKQTNDFFKEIESTRKEYKLYVENLEKINSEQSVDDGEIASKKMLSKEAMLDKNIEEIILKLGEMGFDVDNMAKSDFEYILTLPSDEYLSFKSIVESRVKEATDKGITNAKYEDGKFYENDYGVSSLYESVLINNVVCILVEPNVSVDVEATAKAMDTAVKSVEPVTYVEGQVIVSKGDVITEEQLQILIKLNLVGGLQDLSIPLVSAYLIVLAMMYAVIGLVFGKKGSEKYLANNYKLLYLFLNIIMTIVVVFLPTKYNVILSPLFLFTFLLASIFNNYIATIMAILYTIMYIVLDRVIPAEVVFFLLSSTFIASLIVRDIERFKFAKIAVLISTVSGIVYFLTYYIININNLSIAQIFLNTIVTTSFMLVSVIVAYGIIPFFEISFNLLTEHRLQDLLNQDRPIFKRMLAETPGTLHHSVVVANLCEAGAKAIGANDTLAKVYGYYHDIGKLSAPMYFVENQIGYNHHDDIDSFESAKIIKNHVTYGIEVRKEFKLPKFLDDAILSHHGTSVIQYFYNKAISDETIEKVDIMDYTYSGITPVSKELTILMIADIVEAGVRSIVTKSKDISEVENFIDKIIDGKIKENQFDNSELTYSDIKKIKQAFLVVLKSMYHNRITYPTED